MERSAKYEMIKLKMERLRNELDEMVLTVEYSGPDLTL